MRCNEKFTKKKNIIKDFKRIKMLEDKAKYDHIRQKLEEDNLDIIGVLCF